MSGNIGVESELNIGSKFFFKLPIIETLSEIDDEINVESKSKKLIGKVLIAEDNKTNQMLLKILLDELGVESVVVDNGAKAVQEVEDNIYNLILMDENMPELNGSEAAKIIRKFNNDKSNIPIIAVTANALVGDKERLLDSGMNDYISKPVDIKKLEILLQRYL